MKSFQSFHSYYEVPNNNSQQQCVYLIVVICYKSYKSTITSTIPKKNIKYHKNEKSVAESLGPKPNRFM